MIKVAFLKYGGMAAGGTERWLQCVAACLPKDRYDVTYFYTLQNYDSGRKDFLENHGIRLVCIHSDGKDADGRWVNTDLHEKFDEQEYDIIQTAISGRKEWPYYLFRKPVVQRIALEDRIDFASNVQHTFFVSDWLRKRWVARGGSWLFSSVVPVGISLPPCVGSLRHSLSIPAEAVVAGFHQRADDNIFSDIPLAAFAKVAHESAWFVILGGSPKYTAQAEELGICNFIQLPHSSDANAISSFLSTLDIFAHGRKDGETFGHVFAEAMLHKLPSLGHAAAATAHKETMGPGGLWARTEADYRRHLQNLLSNEKLRGQLGTAGYDFACKKYIERLYIKDVEAVYESIYRNSLSRRLLFSSSFIVRRVYYSCLLPVKVVFRICAVLKRRMRRATAERADG